MLALFAFIVALLSATIVAHGQVKIETQLVAEMDLPGAKGGKANGTLSFDGKQVFLATKAGLRVFDTSNLSIYSFIKEGEGVLHAWTDSQTGGLFVVEGLTPKDEKGEDRKFLVGFRGKLMYFHTQEAWRRYKPDWVIDRRFGITSPQWLPSLTAHAILETNDNPRDVKSICTVVNLEGRTIGSNKFGGRPIGVDYLGQGRSPNDLHLYEMTISGNSMSVTARPLMRDGTPRLHTVSNVNLKKLYGNDKQIVRPFTKSSAILSTGEGTRKMRFRGYRDGDIYNFAVGLPNALPQLHKYTPLTTSTGIVSYFESRNHFLAEFYPGQLRSRSGVIPIQKRPNLPHSIIDVVQTEDKILVTSHGYIKGETWGLFLTTVDISQNQYNSYWEK